MIVGIALPDSPDGYASPTWGNFVRIGSDEKIRCTDEEGGYRIIAETPEDLLGPLNPMADDSTPDNYLICDRTGFKVPVSEGLKQEWNGTMVRAKSYEPRHPLDLVRTKPESVKKGSPRPEQVDRYVEDLYPNGVTLDDLDP